MKNTDPSNDQLIDELADHVSAYQESFLDEDKKRIARKIRFNFLLRPEHVEAINNLVDLLRQMRDENLDIARQSGHTILLGLAYAQLKKQLLALMDGQREALR